ncbi:hypothetical protein Pla110_13210 [Polystyrenella longa]|uniref:Uncharacterized protein n=1 Tax=Polystyrenella longa TaxID=2528007 RepID=A0A518CK58_9PLAN|nr:DUF6263 family protein [Polystyrenella longa]QDU79610.1 hypothetical protein Pla110_13210 [Polystyrenella longa]
MRIRYIRTLLVALICVAVLPATAAEPMQLKYQFSKDKPLNYRITTAMEQTQKVGEQSSSMKMVNMTDTIFSLDEKSEEGDFSLSSVTNRLRVTMDNPLADAYEYDSASEENPTEGLLAAQMTPIFNELKGAQLKLRLSSLGEILEVKGYAELMKAIIKKVPAAAGMAGSFSDEAAKKQYEEVFPTWLDKPVAEGDQWESEFVMDLGPQGKANGKKTYAYRGPSEVNGRATVLINVKHEIEINIDVNQGLSTVEGLMKTQDSEGEIHFDPATGEIVKVDTQYLIVGSIKVTAQGQVRVVESSQDHHISVELISETEKKE